MGVFLLDILLVAIWACWAAGVALMKMFANIFSADIHSPHGEANRADSEGCFSTWTNSVAATAAVSAEVRFGISQSCGKKSTVRAICSIRVFIM